MHVHTHNMHVHADNIQDTDVNYIVHKKHMFTIFNFVVSVLSWYHDNQFPIGQRHGQVWGQGGRRKEQLPGEIMLLAPYTLPMDHKLLHLAVPPYSTRLEQS